MKLTKDTEIVRWPMMRSDHTGVCLWFPCSIVVDEWHPRVTTACVSVVRYEVVVLVEGGLGLLIDDQEYLVDGSPPCDRSEESA